MASYFKDHLIHFLPEEFASRDIGVGDLSNFLQVIAIPLDEFDQFIEDFPIIFDVDNCPSRYLPYLANMLNFPLSGRDDEETQRLQLKNAVHWYQRKGLQESFRTLFYSLGYAINLVELWTKNYLDFKRYPGTWVPPIFRAEAVGTMLVMMDITPSNRNMRLRIDGGNAVIVELDIGKSRLLVDIASEINDAIVAVGSGTCTVENDHLTIKSGIMGANSIVHIVDVEFSAYATLGLAPGIIYGIDYTVPNDWPELQENGGKWYKSPHFGIEAFSIRGRVIDADEFTYVRERIELVRPAHTVLKYIDYAQTLAEYFAIEEDDFLATIDGEFVEQYPFPICIDRGKNCTYEYIRDGMVPDRSDDTRIAYGHIRNARNDCYSRSQFTYNYAYMIRNDAEGPVQMPDRSVFAYYRDGYPDGNPKRSICQEVEELLITFDYDFDDGWCASHLRRAGLILRDDPSSYVRDGTFTEDTWRGQSFFIRDGEEPLFSRYGCTPPLEAKPEILYKRTDLPDVYFRSMESMASMGQWPDSSPPPSPFKHLLSRRPR